MLQTSGHQHEHARSSAKFNSEFSLLKYIFTFRILMHLYGHSWDAGMNICQQKSAMKSVICERLLVQTTFA